MASLDQKPGEVDFQNCKILYLKLQNLSEAIASDERLWAGLCNKTFYAYMRSRWQLAKKHLRKSADDADSILMRFFYKNAGRSGMFRNGLARFWWTGKLTYKENLSNHWELLDAIGSDDIISKISDIFYSNTYSSNKEIAEGFCRGLQYFRSRDIRISNRDHIRPTAQYLNALGGGVLLDVYSAKEIESIVIKRINALLKKQDTSVIFDMDLEQDSLLDVELDDTSLDAQEVNEDYYDYLDSLQESSSVDLNSLLGTINEVEYGSKVLIHVDPKNTDYIMEMPLAGESLNPIQKAFIGKGVGEEWEFRGNTYHIVDIRL